MNPNDLFSDSPEDAQPDQSSPSFERQEPWQVAADQPNAAPPPPEPGGAEAPPSSGGGAPPEPDAKPKPPWAAAYEPPPGFEPPRVELPPVEELVETVSPWPAYGAGAATALGLAVLKIIFAALMGTSIGMFGFIGLMIWGLIVGAVMVKMGAGGRTDAFVACGITLVALIIGQIGAIMVTGAGVRQDFARGAFDGRYHRVLGEELAVADFDELRDDDDAVAQFLIYINPLVTSGSVMASNFDVSDVPPEQIERFRDVLLDYMEELKDDYPEYSQEWNQAHTAKMVEFYGIEGPSMGDAASRATSFGFFQLFFWALALSVCFGYVDKN